MIVKEVWHYLMRVRMMMENLSIKTSFKLMKMLLKKDKQ
jgi:hypothetical protein